MSFYATIIKILKEEWFVVLEHEIPAGSKLYFGKSAKIKRQIETKASCIFSEYDYMEILTPTFCYLEHQRNFKSRKLVRLSNESNQPISLRIDSTLDLMRILTKRLLRSSQHKKWFYIQPFFTYPTSEIHQIGLEHIGSSDMREIICIVQKVLNAFHVAPVWQLSNVNIPKLCSMHSALPLEVFGKMDITKLIKEESYMKHLIYIHDEESLKESLKHIPLFLKEELEHLLEIGSYIEGEKIFAPLYYPSVPYYQSLVFNAFLGNSTLLSGGQYEMNGLYCNGCGIYTDSIIDIIIQQGLFDE